MPESFTYLPRRTVPHVSFSGSDLTSPMSVASGGFATLWRAGNDGQYAIKCFNNGGMAAAEEEFEALLRLSGKRCVPQVYGLGTFVDGMEQGSAAIVEEYVEGYTLATVLKRGMLTGSLKRPVLDVPTVISIAKRLVRALEELEQVGISHRDLSANNVMLSKSCIERRLADGIDLWLIDFGQSTPVSRPSVTPSFRARLATVPYGAPEMYGGAHWEERNSSKCDIWSFGAIVVTMLAGEYWPEEIEDLSMGISSSEDLKRIAQAKREPLDLCAQLARIGRNQGQLEKRLAYIVRLCTQYDPSQRPTASEVEGLMERLVPGGTPSTPPRNAYGQRGATRGVWESRSRRGNSPTGRGAGSPIRGSVTPVPNLALGNASDFRLEGTTLIRYVGSAREVAVPEGTLAIAASAFRGCDFIERVFLPSTVHAIGDFAFAGCASLRGIVISSVERLGVGVFCECSSLTSMVVCEPVAEIPPQAFLRCVSLRWVGLPASTRAIGREAFAGCVSLSQMTIPQSVVRVDARAFAECDSLRQIVVPATLVQVGEGAFETGARGTRGSVAVVEGQASARRKWLIALLVVLLLVWALVMIVWLR